jgi:hypothetical protein
MAEQVKITALDNRPYLVRGEVLLRRVNDAAVLRRHPFEAWVPSSGKGGTRTGEEAESCCEGLL